MMSAMDLKGLKGLSWVRLSFVDVFGAAHSVQLPASRFERAVGLGLRVTFMPRPLENEAGSGLHLHQRVEGRLLDESGKLDDDGRAFVAGQLAHARGLSALPPRP